MKKEEFIAKWNLYSPNKDIDGIETIDEMLKSLEEEFNADLNAVLQDELEKFVKFYNTTTKLTTKGFIEQEHTQSYLNSNK